MKISVLIPCYNCEDYIQECIQSCLNQDYDDYELIVIDNESQDSSVQKIKQLHKSNNFIFDVAKNIYPRCADEAIEKLHECGTGEYYTIIGSDDKIKPDYIRKNVEKIKSLNCDFLQSSNQWYTGVLESGHENTLVAFQYSNLKDLKQRLLSGCCVSTPTMFYKTELMKTGKLKPRPLKYSGAADYDLFCQMVDQDHYIHNAGEWLGYMYRMHPNQATWKMQKDEIKYDKLIQKKWRDKWTSWKLS